MQGTKRDRQGNARKLEHRREAPREVVRNAYTPMFETFRDELDEHHDRRERVVKTSRDVTALSKKIIFTLQRVQKISPDFPGNVAGDVAMRLKEIMTLLAGVVDDVQGINRWRYLRQMSCIEELIEAVAFRHYLRNQSLMGMDRVANILTIPPEEGDGSLAGDELPHVDSRKIALSPDEYLLGIFDLSGEMMRFATTSAALTGKLAAASSEAGGDASRNVMSDMQALGSFYEMLPQQSDKTWKFKMETLRASVKKVERIGYGLTVRAGEKPTGWMPDAQDSNPGSPV